MISILATLLLTQTGSTAVESYFGLKPGVERVYQQDIDFNGRKTSSTITESVGEPEEIVLRRMIPNPDNTDLENLEIEQVRTETAIPFRISIDGRDPQTVYYRALEDYVYVVGVEKGKLLPFAYPVLSVGSGEQVWSYSGPIMVMGAPAPAVIKGTSRPRKDYEFNGKKYPAIDVAMTYQIDLGAGMVANSEQTTTYAKGLGLVEFKETGRLDKNVTKSTKKLKSIRGNDRG